MPPCHAESNSIVIRASVLLKQQQQLTIAANCSSCTVSSLVCIKLTVRCKMYLLMSWRVCYSRDWIITYHVRIIRFLVVTLWKLGYATECDSIMQFRTFRSSVKSGVMKYRLRYMLRWMIYVDFSILWMQLSFVCWFNTIVLEGNQRIDEIRNSGTAEGLHIYIYIYYICWTTFHNISNA